MWNVFTKNKQFTVALKSSSSKNSEIAHGAFKTLRVPLFPTASKNLLFLKKTGKYLVLNFISI